MSRVTHSEPGLPMAKREIEMLQGTQTIMLRVNIPRICESDQPIIIPRIGGFHMMSLKF